MVTSYPPEPDQPVYSPPPATAPPLHEPQQPTAYPSVSGYGYPPPPGYPAYPTYTPIPNYGHAFARPGLVTTSAVFCYVLGGLLVLAAIVLFVGASASDELSAAGFDTSSATAELVFDGVLDLAAAGLLIAGGVVMSGRRAVGRTLVLVGVGITAAESLYWLIRTDNSDQVSFVFYALVFAALAVLAGAFAATPTTRNWLAGADGSHR